MARFFFGGFGADTVLGTSGADFVFGFGGDDYIDTGAGNDLIFAGSGNDTVYAGSGNDTVFASRGNDVVYGGEGRDRLFGGSGNDFMDGGAGNDYLSGSRGMDVLFGGAGDDNVYGGSDEDLLYGGSGYDRVFGQSGDDTLVFDTTDAAGYRNDYYSGGSGTDTLVLEITAEEFASQAFADDFAALQSYIDGGSRGNFTFDAIALTVRSIEDLDVFIDGVEVDPADAGPGDGGGDPDPVAVDDAATLSENGTATGNVLANDVDADGQTVTLVSGPSAGTLTLAADGSYTFETGTEFDSLGAGESQLVTFTYAIDGTDQSATVTLTVTGTNDAPTVGAAQSATVSEDGASVTLDLLDGAADVDSDALFVTLTDALPAGLTLSGSELTLDPSDAAFQGLAAGETLNLTVSFDVEDGAGGRTPQTATFTVTGTNDAPNIAAALSAAADEGGNSVSVDLADGASDVDGDDLTITVDGDLPIGVSLDGTTLSLDPTNASFQSLAAGETETITVTYTVADGQGGTASGTATFTVTGTNDAPVAAADLSASATEDGAVASLELTSGATDADGDTLTAAVVGDLPAGVSFDGTTLSLNPSDAAFQGLAADETATVTVAFTVTDGTDTSAVQTATFTVTGTNDAPTVAGALSAAADEGDAAFTVDLLAGASDVDNGADLSVSFRGELPAGVSLDGTTLSLDPSDAAFDSLSAGETAVLELTYQVEDGEGGTVQQSVTLTVTGTNDAPTVAAALNAAATEDGESATIDIATGASDVDGDALTITVDADLPAGVSLDGTVLTLDPTNEAFQSLAEGEVTTVVIAYTVTDPFGATAPGTATFTITGTNDGPDVDGDLSANAVEDGSSVAIDVTTGATDLDGETITASVDGALPAGVTLDGNVLTLDPPDAAYQSLSAGERLDIAVDIILTDGSGGTATRSATFVLIGSNDAPTVSAALSAAATEGGEPVSVNLLDNASDVDANDTLTAVLPSELPAGVSVDGNVLSLDPSDAAFDDLGAGDVREVVVEYTVDDGQGGSVAQTVTFTVTGTNDAPTVFGALSATADEGDAAVSVDLLSGASDVDLGDSLSVVGLGPLPAGVSLDGTTLTLDPSDAAFDSLAAGQTQVITRNFTLEDGEGGSVAQSVTFTVTGTNDAPTVAGELSVTVTEGALGVIVDLLDGASDVDDGDTLSIENLSELPAGVSRLGDSVDVNAFDAAFDSLGAGESEVITLTFDIVDSRGASVPQTLTITVLGTNDVPVVDGALFASATEGGDNATINLLDGATDVDANNTLSIDNVSELPAGVSLDGAVLSLDATNPSFDSLAAGEEIELTVTYDVVDGEGGVAAQSATFIITGTNDAPVVAGALSAAATEDGEAVTLDLLSGASDVDNGAELSVTGLSDLPSGVSLDGSTITVDPSDASFQSLAADETVTIMLSYTVTDGQGGEVAQTATITVTGTNDTPTVSGALRETTNEADAAFDVDLLSGAADVDNGAVLSVANVVGLVPGLTLDGTTLSVDPTEAEFDALAAGSAREITVTFDVVDQSGLSVPQTLSLTVFGTNDAPVVSAALTAAADEGDAAFTVDLLDGASDVDARSSLSVTNVSALPDGVSLTDNTLSVDPADAAFDALAAGEEQLITVTFDIVDGEGGSVPQTLSLTITGTNDAPVVAASLSADAVEGSDSVSVDLLDGASDVDNGAVLSVANLSELPAGVSLDGTVLTLDPTDAAYDDLATDETRDVVVTFDVIDGLGGSVPQSVTFTVTGTNDAPIVAAPLTAASDEDDAGFTVDLLDGASDVDDAAFTVTGVAELPAGVTLDGNVLSVDPSDASFQSLAAGEELVLEIGYTVEDDEGASVAQTLSLTITGTNDAPTVAGAITESVTEDGPGLILDLLDGAADVDNGARLSVANVEGLVPGVSLDGTALVVNSSDAAFQSLGQGQTREIEIIYDVVDEQGVATPQTATITVTGTNDAPTVDGALSAAQIEGNGLVTVNLFTGALDVDIGSSLSIANLSALPAGVEQRGSNTLTLNADDPAFDALAEDEVRTIVITYDIVDQFGASVPQSVTFTVTGTNDVPTVAAALTGAVDEDAADLVVDLLDGATDVDNGAVLSVTNLSALPDGVSFDGQFVTVDADNAAFQGLAAGEEQLIEITYDVTDQFGASVPQTLTLTVTGTNDAPTVDAPLSTAATEDGAGVSITLLDGADDVDGDTLSVVFDTSELVAGVTFDGTALTLDPTDASFQELAEGQERVLDFTYTIEDGQGGSVTQTATFTVTGTNDVPTVSGAQVEAVSEDTVTDLDLLALAGDVDLGDILDVANVTGLVAGLSVIGSTLTVDGADPSLQSLDAGEEREITLSYDIVDIEGATVPQTLTLTIRGTNDVPTVAAALTETLSEDDFRTRIDLLDGATDADAGAVLSVSLPDGATLPDGFSFDGTDLIVSPRSNADIQALADGQSLDITVDYVITDDQGASVPQSLTLSFDGANDAPTLTQIVGLQEVGTDEAFSLTLPEDLFVDVDAGDALTLTAARSGGDPLPAWLSFDPATGTLSGTPGAGDAGGLNVVIRATDLSGATRSTTITFAIGEGVIVGTDGDDDLLGTDGADTFFGGLGNDRMVGGSGDDTYVFNIGDGQDTVEDTGFNNTDTVQFNGRNFADATILRDGGSDTITFSFANGDTVTLVEGLDASFGDIERVVFEDVTLDVDALRAAVIAPFITDGDDVTFGTVGDDIFVGSAGDDRIVGQGGNDLFLSNAGNDTLVGEGGNDTYVFEIGDGQDIVDDTGFNGTDTVQFNGRNFADATISRDGGSDTITFSFVNGDTVTLVEGLDANFGDIERVVFDDVTLDVDALRETVVALTITDGDDATFGTVGNDTFVGSAGDDVIVGQGGADTFLSNVGNDTLVGEGGNDTYVFAVGDGQDVVDDRGFQGTDTIRFEGRDLADAIFIRDGASDTFTILFTNGDRVEVIDGLDQSFGRIERIEFDDQTLDVEGIRSAIVTSNATNGDDTINGTDASETIIGLRGNDTLSGRDGSDTYIFNVGDGQDIVDDNGFDDNDTLVFTGRDFADATFSREGTSATYTIDFANGDSVQVVGGIGDRNDQIETIIFDDVTLDAAAIRQAIVDSTTSDGDDTVVGTNFADTIDGGTGNDTLNGRDGSDRYVFEIGDGQDIVDDNGRDDNDTLEFVGRNLADATFTRDEGSASYTISFANGDSVQVVSGLNGREDTIETIVFDDVTLDYAAIRQTLVDINVTDGDDVLFGTTGADVLDGGTGNDTLSGGDGSDSYVFEIGDGQDFVDDNGRDDTDELVFVGRDLADATITDIRQEVDGVLEYTISFANGDSVEVNRAIGSREDQIERVVFEDQTLEGQALYNFVIGSQATDGDDTVIGSLRGDTIDGGTGNDTLSGADGSDLYVFEIGDGQDVVDDDGRFDTDALQFVGRNFADATFTDVRRESDGVLEYTISFANGDSVEINRAIGSASDQIERLIFEDITLTGDALYDAVVNAQATDGDDTVLGTDRSETIDGGTGNDTLSGGDGSDSYVFEVGDGEDVVDDRGDRDTDVIRLNGRNSDDATIVRVEGTDDYRISFADGDSVTVIGGLLTFSASNSTRIEQIVFDDITLETVDIFNRVLADGATDGADTLSGTAFEETLNGGLGNDSLSGGDGSDTYVFGIGDGQDTVEDNGGGDTDVLVFEGRDLADATFERSSSGFTVTFANGDSVSVVGGLDSFSDGIERLVFDDQTVDVSDIEFAGIVITGTEASETLDGTSGADTINGFGGNDIVRGFGGDDILNGGDGRDDIEGGTGNDTIDGGDGDDSIAGGSGNDTIRDGDGDDYIDGGDGDDVIFVGAGDDYIEGSDGEDLYIFAQGFGSDELDDFGSFDETDIIRFVDYDYADATFTYDGGDSFTITFEATGDTLSLPYALDTGGDQVELFEFRDRTVTVEELRERFEPIDGTEGDDTLTGTEFADTINGLDGNDTIDAGDGDDIVDGGAGNDVVNGDAGDDDLDGGSGDDVINGGAGDDALSGGLGNDVLTGGAGADYLEGGSGDNRILFFEGDGNDTVGLNTFRNEGGDTIEFPDYDFADATFQSGGDLVGEGGLFSDNLLITFANGDSVEVEFFFNPSARFNGFVFADQSVTREQIAALLIAEQVTVDGDRVFGTSLDETIEAGTGDDELFGGDGNDTYVYNPGDGNDVILDGFGNDTIDFTTYTVADATITTNGPNITFTFADGGSVMIAPDVFFGGEGPTSRGIIETFVFADQTLDFGQVLELASPADPLVLVGTDGADTLVGDGGNDTLTGAGGDDRLEGEYGNDLYVYTAGDGADVIADAGGDDSVQISGYASTDATFSEGPNGLLIDFGNGDSITVEYAGLVLVGGPIGEGPGPIFVGDDRDGPIGPGGPLIPVDAPTTEPVETFVFDDVTLTFEDIIAIIDAGVAGEEIFGSRDADDLVGTDGNDLIDGGSGNDTIEGGLGNDVMEGGSGDDRFFYNLGDGNDTISDGSGTDILVLRGITEGDIFAQRTFFFDEDTGLGQPAIVIEVFNERSGAVETITVMDGSIEFVVFEGDPRDPEGGSTIPIDQLVFDGGLLVAEPSRDSSPSNFAAPVTPEDAGDARDGGVKSDDFARVAELPGGRMNEATELDAELDLFEGISGTAKNGMSMLTIASEMTETDFAVFEAVEDDAGLF